MPDVTSVEIAGVNFLLSCPPAISVEAPFPTHQPFFGRRNREPWSIDVSVDFELGELPATGGLTPFFDSGETWTLFRDGDDYLLQFEPYWVARISPDATRVIVHCSEEFIRKRDGNAVTISSPIGYPLDQFILVYALAQREGVLVHAAGIGIGGRGFIFPGRSGAGKSTITGLFGKHAGIELVSDDRIVIRKIEDTFRGFGTPWPGEGGIAKNSSVPLAGMFFITHEMENRIRPLEPRDALERLFVVASIPWYNDDLCPRLLGLCEELVSRVPAYELAFRPDAEVGTVVKEFVSSL